MPAKKRPADRRTGKKKPALGGRQIRIPNPPPSGEVEIDLDIAGQEEFDTLWLVQALKLVRGERRKQYGHIIQNWSKLRVMATAIFDVPVSYTQIAYFLIAMKMSRELSYGHNEDNNRDIAGYIQCLQDALALDSAQLGGNRESDS